MEENIENFNDIEKNKNIVFLTEQEKFYVYQKCSWVNHSNQRARMAANFLSVVAARKILENYNIEYDTSISLQQISSIISRWDIAEIFVGDCRISVRNNFLDYKLFVPKKHKRYGLLGDLLMFVRFENDCVKLLGFLNPSDLDEEHSDNENYYIEQDQLKSIDEINFNVVKDEENIEELKNERIKIIQYLEGSLDDKVEFFKLLSKSKYLRNEMIKFENSEKIYSKLVENQEKIQTTIEKEVDNISKLADAFIQSKTIIMNSSDSEENNNAENFKIECARANLEKLFNLSPINNEEYIDIQNKTNEEVMDKLLTPSNMVISEDRLPMVAVLKAFRFFAILLLVLFFTAGIFCYHNYSVMSGYNSILKYKQNVSEWVINVKKK